MPCSTNTLDYNALYCKLYPTFKMDQHTCIYVSHGCHDHYMISNSPHILRPARNSCEQHNFNIAAHSTAKMSLDFQLVKIKVQASSCTHKLQAIEQIKDGSDPGLDPEDDTEFANIRMEIEVQILYAIHAFEEIVTMTEQLLSSPPSYHENPGEQRQKQLEVLVLSAGAHDYVIDLQKKLRDLKHQVNDSLGTRVQEACFRAQQIHTEAHDVLGAAKKLLAEQGTR